MQTHAQYLKNKILSASHVETYTRLYFHLKAQRSILQSIHDQAKLKLQTIEHQKNHRISHPQSEIESNDKKNDSLFHPKHLNDIENLSVDQLNNNEITLKEFINTIESMLVCDIKTVIFEACNFIIKTRSDTRPSCTPDILKLINIFTNSCVAFVKFPTSLLASFKNAGQLNSPRGGQGSKKKSNTIIDAPISAYYEKYDEPISDENDESSSKNHDRNLKEKNVDSHTHDSIINPSNQSPDSQQRLQKTHRTHRSQTQNAKHHHHHHHHHQKSEENTVVCRLCNEHIPINLFAEHINSCAIAFKSEVKVQDVNQMLLNEYNLIETQYLSDEWPGECEKAVNVVIPMLHLCILLMRAQDIEENTNDSLEELENIEGNILQIPFTEESVMNLEPKHKTKAIFTKTLPISTKLPMNRTIVDPDVFHSYTKLDVNRKNENDGNENSLHSTNQIIPEKGKSTETDDNESYSRESDEITEEQIDIKDNSHETNDTSESTENLNESYESYISEVTTSNKTSDYSSDYSISQSSKKNSVEQFTNDGPITSIIKESIKLLREKINLTVVLCAASNVLRNTRLSGSDKITTTNSVRIIDFDFIKLISAGAYARVFLAKMRSTGDIYAIKVTPKSSCTHKNEVLRILTEKNIMLKINHPYIVTFFMEYLPGGDLYSLLQNVGSFDEDTAKLYIYEILLALKFLHTNGIIHRDLKPDNILVAKDGKIKLTDFGLSHLGLIDRRNNEELGETEETTIVGTPDYIAPEILMQKKHSFTCDYWSLGCMLYEFLIGVPPFHADTEEETFKNILSGQYDLSADVGVEDFTEDAIDLIKKLLVSDPNKRLGAQNVDDILNHPWFKGVDPDQEDPPFVPELNSQYDTTYFQQRYSFKEDDSDIIEDINDDKEKQKKQHPELGEKRIQSMISMDITETPNDLSTTKYAAARSAEAMSNQKSLKDEIENEAHGSIIIDEQSSTNQIESVSSEPSKQSSEKLDKDITYLYQLANNAQASRSNSHSSFEHPESPSMDGITDSPLSNSFNPNVLNNYAAVGVDQIIQKNEEILSQSQKHHKSHHTQRAKSLQVQDLIPRTFSDLNIDFDVDLDNRNKMQALASSLSNNDEEHNKQSSTKSDGNDDVAKIAENESTTSNQGTDSESHHAKVKLPESLPTKLLLPPKIQSEPLLISPRKGEAQSGKTKDSSNLSPIAKTYEEDQEIEDKAQPEKEDKNGNSPPPIRNQRRIRTCKSDLSMVLFTSAGEIEPSAKLANSSEPELLDLPNEDEPQELNPLSSIAQSIKKSKLFFILDSPYIMRRMKQLPEDPRAALRRIRAKHRKNIQKLSAKLTEKLSAIHLYE